MSTEFVSQYWALLAAGVIGTAVALFVLYRLCADAEALREIAADRVLVARNLVVQVIAEDYPPRRQDALRSRYLPGLQRDYKPFSF
jgi:hypothetical protein